MENGTLLAAVDLGSNSFRLEIGRYDSGHIERVEYLKETVRQGSGLDEHKNLSLVAMERGWECLARFAERLQGFQKHQVRAVATQTLREARNRDDFTRRAQEVLGFPIKGYTLNAIADELCLSPNTIKTYRTNLYRKLGVSSKQGLVDKFYDEQR